MQLEVFSLKDKSSLSFLKIFNKLLNAKIINECLQCLCGHHLKVPQESLAFTTSYAIFLNKIKGYFITKQFSMKVIYIFSLVLYTGISKMTT